MQLFRLITDSVKAFLRHGCASLAASLAFFSLLSLFPLAFLLLYSISFLVNQEGLGEQFLLSFLKAFLPSLGDELATEIHRISVLESVRWIVSLSCAWFGALVFYELDYALNVVFESTWKRHPLISTAISVALLGATSLLLVVAYVATQVIQVLTAYVPNLWGLDLATLATHDFVLSYTVPFLLAFLIVSLLYRYVPRRRPEWREAMAGAITFGLLWVSAKLLFVTYSGYASVYVRLYGSLLEIVLLLLWVYYSDLLLLLGAAVTHSLQQRVQAAATPSSLNDAA
jgi:membrane protein